MHAREQAQVSRQQLRDDLRYLAGRVPEKERVGTGKKRLRLIAEWHWHGEGSGGPKGWQWCRNCHRDEYECATTHRDTCEYIKRAPATREGARIWAFLSSTAGFLRHEPLTGRIVGFDWAVLLAAAPAFGVDVAVLVELGSAAEAGLILGPTPRAESADGE